MSETLNDIIAQAAADFSAAGLYCGHGFNHFEDEALALVLYAMQRDYSVSADFLNTTANNEEQARIDALIAQRIQQRIPVVYITHTAYFAGLEFYVDERVLVPRSPLAELIAEQFSPWKQVNQIHSMLDLCTGSGCIAIACAQYFPSATVDASDISPDALAVAKINCQRYPEAPINLYQSDVFSNLKQKKYDIIMSNPPYVHPEEMLEVPTEFHHEPIIGLTADDKGLAIVDRILKQAVNYLARKGLLIVEVGNQQAAVSQRYPKLPFTWLDFEHGGEGVFLLTREQLTQAMIGEDD